MVTTMGFAVIAPGDQVAHEEPILLRGATLCSSERTSTNSVIKMVENETTEGDQPHSVVLVALSPESPAQMNLEFVVPPTAHLECDGSQIQLHLAEMEDQESESDEDAEQIFDGEVFDSEEDGEEEESDEEGEEEEGRVEELPDEAEQNSTAKAKARQLQEEAAQRAQAAREKAAESVCKEKDASAKKEREVKARAEAEAKSSAKKDRLVKGLTVAGGVRYDQTTLGSGPEVRNGRKVWVQYEGRLLNGKRFDSGKLDFKLGAGEMIPGFDAAVLGMKVGEERKAVLPPQMAYGARGSPPQIPGNATLIFVVKLLKFK